MYKIAILFVCLILLMTAAVGTTFAFFRDTESSAVSTITAGSVDLDLTVELNQNIENIEKLGNEAEKATILALGQQIPSSPYVTNTGTSDVYVCVRVFIHEGAKKHFTVVEPDNSESYEIIKFNSGNEETNYRSSTLKPGYVEYLFLYKSILKHNERTEDSVSKYISFSPDSTEREAPNLEVYFHANAVQASTFTLDGAREFFKNLDKEETTTAIEP